MINLRRTHIYLYFAILTVAGTWVWQGVNFWTSNPTFNPYGISKNLVGTIFGILGVSQVIVLNYRPNLQRIRVVFAVGGFVTLVWALINTQQSQAGRASWQLPGWVLGFSLLCLNRLLEIPGKPPLDLSDLEVEE